MTDKAKEQEQILFAAYYKDVFQHGFIATDLTELARLAHELLEEGAAFECMASLDGWQIRKVKLVDADSVVVPRKALETLQTYLEYIERPEGTAEEEHVLKMFVEILPRQEGEG